MSTHFPNISLLSDGISPYPGALYGTEGIGVTMETTFSGEDLYIKSCSSTYHKIATIAILLFFIIIFPETLLVRTSIESSHFSFIKNASQLLSIQSSYKMLSMQKLMNIL